MTIKQQGGIFGRNPSFNNVTANTLSVDVDTLYVDETNDRVGINTSSPVVSLESNTTGNGLPASSGTAQANGAFRISSPATSGIIDIGPNGGAPWIQATDRTDLSQSYTLSLNPNGGNVSIGNGNLVIGTSGKGIDFSATSGTGTSELFDDYEEGAVANPLYVGGVQVTSGYSTSAVTYTKVGDTVMMNFYVDYTSPAGTGPSGNVTIGLPFTPTNSAIAGMSLYMSVSAPSYAGAYISVASGVGTAAVTEANINTIYSLAQGERIILRAATAYRAS